MGLNVIKMGRDPELRWKWEMVGGRKSGETTTSTCNFLINQLIFAYACHISN